MQETQREGFDYHALPHQDLHGIHTESIVRIPLGCQSLLL